MKHRYRKKVVLVFFVAVVLLIAGGAGVAVDEKNIDNKGCYGLWEILWK